jgi:hypothetical protein
MPAKKLDMVCWRNGRFPDLPENVLKAVHHDPLGKLVTYDLTGRAVRMQVRYCDGALGAPLIDLTSTPTDGDRIKVVNARRGEFQPIIGQATLQALPAAALARFAYDIRIDDLVFFYGRFDIRQGVTR